MKKHQLLKIVSGVFVAGLFAPALYSLFISLSWRWFWWNYFTIRTISEKFYE